MKFGICTKLDNLDLVKEFGYHYIEPKLSDVAAMTDEELTTARRLLDSHGMNAETYNVFCTSDFNLSYAADFDSICAYAKRAFANAQKLGGEIAVIGSGKARNIPEEYSFEAGRDNFKRILNLVADIAAEHNMKVALEPLNTNETNLVNTLADAEKICEEIGNPNLGFLADLFHMYKNGEDVCEIEKHGKYIIHAHIARRDDSRGAPGIDCGSEDHIAFYNALSSIGYNGRISLEASSKVALEEKARIYSELLAHLKLI